MSPAYLCLVVESCGACCKMGLILTSLDDYRPRGGLMVEMLVSGLQARQRSFKLGRQMTRYYNDNIHRRM